MKLISISDFAFKQDEINGGFGQDEIDKVWNYANFLKQPLKLSMFIPCDEDGSVLKEPNPINYSEITISGIGADTVKYIKAKEKVLFEGFEVHNQDKYSIILVNDNQELTIEFQGNIIFYLGEYIVKNIEDLCFYNQKEQTHTILTESAIKQWNLS